MNNTQQHMHQLALDALAKAYSPYSNFCVGKTLALGELLPESFNAGHLQNG